ncbi:MAG TPA: ATP-binding cassette domain-containing protein [Chitinophagaceae bacterium]|nr:ATP-binding cassette domain-containing protein [Chitinophagaceae bacterium]
MSAQLNPVTRILNLVRLERKEIGAIYFYAILGGLIQLSLPVGIQTIIGFILGATMSTSLKILIILVVGGVLAGGLLQINQMKIIEKIQQRIFVRFSFQIAERIPKLDLKQADSYYLPELVNRFFDITALQKSLSKLLLDVPGASIQILFGLILLSFYHPLFILLSVLLVIVLSVILYYTGNKGLETSLLESRHKYGVAAWLEEMARVIKSLKFSKGSHFHMQKADERVSAYLQYRTSHFSILLFQYKMLVLFKTLITAAMLVIGSFLLVNQQLNIGQFIAAEIVIITVINSVEKLINNLDSVYDVLTSVEKIGKITDKPIEHSGSLPMKEGKSGYKIEMSNISFGYNEDKRIIQNLSVKIEPGQKVCIMGAEGSGKSTVLRLMTGAYTEYDGNILIDNIPIKNYDIASLRSYTGIFLSQQDIFQGSLEENITMGNEEIDRTEVIALFEKVGLLGFLTSLKDGFDTELDPTGHRLPKNVVHKLLLVRALVNNPRLLLLEDPFSGLEETFKLQIQSLLLDRNNPATVVISTNDEQFAQQCDKIVRIN